MTERLLELYNQFGITNYTLNIVIITCILLKIFDIIHSFVNFLFEKSMYYYDKRKELKNNGS